MGMGELISIVIPVYNAEKYIRNCLDSVLEQTYDNIEIILIDDGAEDNSGAICDLYAELDRRIKVLHIANAGVSNARNTGIECCRGEWIAFVDADDRILPNHIKEFADIISNDSIDLVINEFSCVDEHGKQIPERILKSNTKRIMSGDEALEFMCKEMALCGYIWNKVFKKDIIIKNNIRFNPAIRLWEDMLFVAEYISECSSIFINPQVTYLYYLHDNSAVTNKSYELKATKYDAMIGFETLITKLMAQHRVNKGDCLYNWVKRVMGETCINDIINLMRYGEYDLIIVRGRSQKACRSWNYLSWKNKLKLIAFLLCPRVMNTIYKSRGKEK